MHDRPHCGKCGRFVPFEKAELDGKLEGPPMVGWVEWWNAICEKCEQTTGRLTSKEQS